MVNSEAVVGVVVVEVELVLTLDMTTPRKAIKSASPTMVSGQVLDAHLSTITTGSAATNITVAPATASPARRRPTRPTIALTRMEGNRPVSTAATSLL